MPVAGQYCRIHFELTDIPIKTYEGQELLLPRRRDSVLKVYLQQLDEKKACKEGDGLRTQIREMKGINIETYI